MVNSSRQSQYYYNLILLRYLKIFFHNHNSHIPVIGVAFQDTPCNYEVMVIVRSNDNHQLKFFTKIWLAHMVIFTDRKKDKIQTKPLKMFTLFLYLK